ncbi:MAG: hypothetical protein WBQ73_02765 [Candidatus Babeliales bacterium]
MEKMTKRCSVWGIFFIGFASIGWLGGLSGNDNTGIVPNNDTKNEGRRFKKKGAITAITVHNIVKKMVCDGNGNEGQLLVIIGNVSLDPESITVIETDAGYCISAKRQDFEELWTLYLIENDSYYLGVSSSMGRQKKGDHWRIAFLRDDIEEDAYWKDPDPNHRDRYLLPADFKKVTAVEYDFQKHELLCYYNRLIGNVVGNPLPSGFVKIIDSEVVSLVNETDSAIS